MLPTQQEAGSAPPTRLTLQLGTLGFIRVLHRNPASPEPRQHLWAACAAPLLLSTCGANGIALSLSDYDTSCSAPTDCVPVFIGQACGPCLCPTGAINRADQARHDA